MQKEFDKWNAKKQKIDNSNRNFYVKKRDVVWLHLGINIGDEENGKGELFLRPVLVLKVFNSNLFFGVPMSSVIKPNNKFYLEAKVNYQDKIKDEIITDKRSVLLSHGKLFDTKRIIDSYGRLDSEDFIKTKNAIRALLFSDQDFSGSRPSPIYDISISQPQILSSDKFAVIYVTFKDKVEAERIVEILLKEKLIACANYFDIEANYFWKGENTLVKEVSAFLKTKIENFEKIKEIILKEHSYEIPCIIKFEVESNLGYEEWVKNETNILNI